LWDLDSIETNPVNEPCADIVFDASSKNVDTVIVRGEILIKNKVNTRVNEQELIKQCDKLLKEIKSR
jgi:cytosine/adenosine deaminase-related metal-dependent hydrolase